MSSAVDRVEEEGRSAIVFNDRTKMMAIDAALEDEADERAKAENLKWEITRKKERIKLLQERVVTASTASSSRQKLVEELGGRLGVLTTELTGTGVFNVVSKKTLTKRQKDQEKMAAYEARFEQMIDWVLTKSLDASVMARTDAALGGAVDESTLPRRTLVHYCPDGQDKHEATDEFMVRVSTGMTFRELRAVAARYMGEVAEECLVEDQRTAQWPLDGTSVMREIQRYRGDQVIRLVRKPVDEADDEREEGGELDEEEGEEEEPAVENLMALLNATSGEAAEGGEEGAPGGPPGADALLDDDSDSDDDGKQREEYVEPPMNRRKLIIEMILHSIFLALFYISCRGKRNIDSAFRLFQALQTVFIDEAFGDFNEKTFMDVATFEEMWDWAENVLQPGLFDSDLDWPLGEGNIMMYNRLVGGMRVRQVRVSNSSCDLPSSIMRVSQDPETGERVDTAFVFPHYNDGGGGECFGSYAARVAATEDFGPCTAAGRKQLNGVEGVDIDKYNTSCDGSGFQYWTARQTQSPPVVGQVTTYDGGGYVRDVVAPAEKVLLGQYSLVEQDFIDAFTELRQYLWVDEQTRAVMISFSIYNGNFNLYASCRFVFEFTPGGTVIPSYTFKMLKFYLWTDVKDLESALGSGQVIQELFVYLFVLKNILLELWNWGRIRWRYGTSGPYFSNIWNCMEILNIIPFFFSLAVRFTFMSLPEWERYNVFVGRYQELGNLANLYALTFMLDSISILISVLKYFKYLRLSDSTNMLWNTLSRAARDMAFFGFTLLIFLFAFMVIGMQMFGAAIEDFTDFVKSFSILMQMLLGVVDMYNDLLIAAPFRIIGMGYFFFYIIFMFLILINVFLAILNDAYAGVKGEMEERKEQRRIEAEEREALGLDDERREQRRARNRARVERARVLAASARGRYHRFRNRVAEFGKKKKNAPPTSTADF